MARSLTFGSRRRFAPVGNCYACVTAPLASGRILGDQRASGCVGAWSWASSDMASRVIAVDELSADERIKLMGQLWDSLDPSLAAPVTPALAAELERREHEADANPSAGESWSTIRRDLEKKLR